MTSLISTIREVLAEDAGVSTDGISTNSTGGGRAWKALGQELRAEDPAFFALMERGGVVEIDADGVWWGLASLLEDTGQDVEEDDEVSLLRRFRTTEAVRALRSPPPTRGSQEHIDRKERKSKKNLKLGDGSVVVMHPKIATH
jgi:hypothetical protein